MTSTCSRAGGPADTAAGARKSPVGLLLGLLTIGTFAVGSDGLVLNGLLPSVASDLSVSVAAAGQLATAFAVTYAVAAPTLAVLTGDLDRRRVLAAGAVVFAVGTTLQALAPSMGVMVVARVLAGAGAAAYVSNATATAGTLAGPQRQGQALALVYGGFTVATVLGGPLGIVLAGPLGWRPVLGGIGLIGLLAAAGTALLPAVRPPSAGLAERIAVLLLPDVPLTLAVTVLAQAAGMAAQVYLPAVLAPTAGALLPALLLACGTGIVVGTWCSGRLVDRVGSQVTRRASFVGLVLVLGAGVPAALGHLGWLFVVLPLLGLAAGTVLVPQQHRLLAAAPSAPAVVLGWGSSSIYLGAALGSVAGGALLAGSGPVWLGPGAAVLAVLALALTAFSRPEHISERN